MLDLRPLLKCTQSNDVTAETLTIANTIRKEPPSANANIWPASCT